MNDRLAPGPGSDRPAVPWSDIVHTPSPERYDSGEVELRDIWATLKRRRRTILWTTLVIVALVAAWTAWVTPVWSANTLIRVDERESGLLVAPELAALTGFGAAGSQIETELRILQTRPIAEEVVERLDLNFTVTDPREIPRETLFTTVQLGRESIEGEFEIRPTADGGYRVASTSDETPSIDTEFEPGERVEIPGGWFVLADLATGTDESGSPLPSSVDFETLPFQEAVKRLSEDMSALRPERDANVLQVGYRTTDRTLVHQVPNAIAETFIARRTATNKADARSTVGFIQNQVDSTYAQLRAAEDSLRRFQESEQVIAVEAEAEAQIGRLAALQAQRAQLDAERSALARLLADIDAESTEPDYRRLASFPTFFRNQAVVNMLASLVQADSARSALLARATPSHPDVIVVEGRIDELEGQLGSIGRNYLRALNDQVAALDEELGRFGEELGEVPDRQITFLRIRRQVEMLGELYTTLQTRLKEAQVQEAVDDSHVRIVEEAIEPLRPVSPKPVQNLALAMALGLVLGVVLAFIREYGDRRIHADESLDTLFGLPTMARIPSGASPAGRGARRLITLDDVESAEAESYRTLRTNVGFPRYDGGRVLVVASPATGEGASATAANLAVTLAQKGQRTLLVDADMRRPFQHEVFVLARSPGLADLLLGDAEVDAVLHRTELEPLFVMPAGRAVKSPAELLDSTRMDEVLRLLRPRFDMIVLDVPPVLAVTDAAVLAPRTDGVVLVLRAEKTEKDAIDLAIRQLRQVDATVLGAVVTNADAEFSYQASYSDYVGESEDSGLGGLLDRIRSAFS